MNDTIMNEATSHATNSSTTTTTTTTRYYYYHHYYYIPLSLFLTASRHGYERCCSYRCRWHAMHIFMLQPSHT